jgi:hypothetical protein
MQKAIVVGLMLGTMALMWWAGLVFYYEGDYYSVPPVSVGLLLCALLSFAFSLRNTGDKDKAERWYLTREEVR